MSVRLLLFRHFLLQDHQPKPTPIPSLYADDPQVMPHVVLHCQLNCAKAAGDMIEFIARNLPEQTQAYILPSNWYTVSCKKIISDASTTARHPANLKRCLYGSNYPPSSENIPVETTHGESIRHSLEQPITSGARYPQGL